MAPPALGGAFLCGVLWTTRARVAPLLHPTAQGGILTGAACMDSSRYWLPALRVPRDAQVRAPRAWIRRGIGSCACCDGAFCGCRIYGFAPIAVFASHFLDLWALHTRIRRIHGSCVRRVGVLPWATRVRISAAQAFAFLRLWHLSAAAMYTDLWQKRHFFTFMNFSYIILGIKLHSRAGSAVV